MVVDGFDSAAFDQCVLELFLTASNLVWRVTEFQGKNIEEHRLEKNPRSTSEVECPKVRLFALRATE